MGETKRWTPGNKLRIKTLAARVAELEKENKRLRTEAQTSSGDRRDCPLCGQFVRPVHRCNGGQPAVEMPAPPEHVCGLQGYDPMRDDPCPACRRAER